MVEVLWHRRETRRPTENTNLDLRSKDSKILAPEPNYAVAKGLELVLKFNASLG